MSKTSIDDVLEFAIQAEEGAYQFYLDLAERTQNSALRRELEGFAQEELGHKQKLENLRRGEASLQVNAEGVADLQLADYLVEVEPGPDLSYQDALILAMKREKAAFRLYSDMAATARDSDCEKLFLALAQEEAKHKLRFEIEYDDVVLEGN